MVDLFLFSFTLLFRSLAYFYLGFSISFLFSPLFYYFEFGRDKLTQQNVMIFHKQVVQVIVTVTISCDTAEG